MEEEQLRESDGDCDMISELPKGVLGHILSFLSQEEAVRTSVLSKAWRRIWCTRPNIEVALDLFDEQEAFLSFLEQTLQGYLNENLSLEEFKVSLAEVSVESVSLLEIWIPVVILDMRAKKFHLLLDLYPVMPPYELPLIVFESEFLQELHLWRCKLPALNKVLCRNLTSLNLLSVPIDEETFQSIVSHCPLIENMKLVSCKGLESIEVKQLHKLKYFWYWGFTEDTEVHLPSSLQTITFQENCKWLAGNEFTNLKSLDLYKVRLSSKFFDYFSCNFPILESLSLDQCYGFEELQLSSNSIKHLTIWFTEKSTKFVNIDSPNLISLELFQARLSSKWFDCFSCNFPILESLGLKYCYNFEELQLSSNSIKQLTIWDRGESIKVVNVDAPSLISFEYDQRSSQSITLPTIASNKKWKSKSFLCLCVDVVDVDKWFLKLKGMLLLLSQSEISLHISVRAGFFDDDDDEEEEEEDNSSVQDLDNDGDLNKPPALVVEFLTLDAGIFDGFPDYPPVFLNRLFHICHPRFIGRLYWIVTCIHEWHREHNESLQSLWNYLQLHQDLEEIGIEVKTGGREWCPVSGTSLSECEFPGKKRHQNIRFQLKWREVTS